MDIEVITARDLPEAWFLCLRTVLRRGRYYTIQRGSEEGAMRLEPDLIVLKVEKPGTKPTIPDTPDGIPPPTDMKYVDGYLNYLLTGDKAEGEDYTYGEDLAPQIPKLIEMYQNGVHNTNQACMTVGNRESINLTHSQCLRVVDTRVMDGALHFIVYFRSWDAYGGLPGNLAGLQQVKEFLAGEIGVRDGSMIAMSKGLHLYNRSWEHAEAVARIRRRPELACYRCDLPLPNATALTRHLEAHSEGVI